MIQQTLFNNPRFKKGQGIRFKNMCQPNYPPFYIKEVREVRGFYEYLIDYKWWTSGCLELFTKEMEKDYRR